MSKYRGEYTNARDCKHALTTEDLMAMVEVKESCPWHGRTPHNIVPVKYCQYHCKDYKKKGG